tara:strand:+ start:49189 stop:49974 length:786 start_codon:yes stop_codon:yes gene_type:complete
MRKITSNFLDAMPKTITTSNGWYNRYNEDLLFDMISSYDKKLIKSLVSDPYWNKYPSYTYGKGGPRSYGPAVHSLVRVVSMRSQELLSVILKNSAGYFLCATLDTSSGKERISAARRAKKSKDVRARKRAAKILPVKSIRSMSCDKDAGVRNIVIKRVGIDNCYRDFVNDNDGWISSQAKVCLSMDEVSNCKEQILTLVENSSRSWADERFAKRLISLLPKEDLLYLLNIKMNIENTRTGLSSFPNDVEKIISSRLNTSWE